MAELLVRQSGVGNLLRLQPALTGLVPGPVALLALPHVSQPLAMANRGLPPAQLLWMGCAPAAHALWPAEQILRTGTCAPTRCTGST